jgi:hypothetical protein
MAVIGGIVIDPGVSVVAFNVSGGSADPWFVVHDWHPLDCLLVLEN